MLNADAIFYDVVDDAVELCSGFYSLTKDYIGNVVIQSLMQKCNDDQKLALIQRISPFMASLGVHKNGTWAIQKVIDCATTPAQMDEIVKSLTPYTPLLLLDQFGNYVIQCCLKMGSTRNQFIFDAMASRPLELGQGRFSARAMKTCLDHPNTTKEQQKQVSLAIVQNCVQLCMNPNGSILINWFLETSQVPGRYRVLAPLMLPHLDVICRHKLAAVTVLKIGTL
jgi:hypothetical protein